MSLTVKETKGGGSAPIEPGAYPARCVGVVDLGIQHNDFNNKDQEKVRLIFELPTERVQVDGEDKPRWLSKPYTASLHEKSTLRHDLDAWRGKPFTQEELAGFNLANVINAPCLLTVVNQEGKNTKANEVALAYVNDTTPGIYTLNRNYAAYTIEKVAGNVGFTLWDESTVRRLIVEEPDLMPYYPKKKALKRGIDLKWGKKQITKSVTSGLLQGKSVGKIAKDLQARVTEMNRASAVRAARTAVTGAQNGGRMDSYKAASDMGIKVRKRWVATKDGRTRHAHQKLDGQTVEWDEPFTSDLGKIRYPGDPRAKPANVYNCRCTMRTVEKPDIEAEPRKMRVRDPKTGRNVVVEAMTYEQWERWVKSRG